jgi:DNA (cytosine-5)-methyltransferase 1
MSELGGRCVLASEIDRDCRGVYQENFGTLPHGDIRELTKNPDLIPEHDVLCAGFPCQPFSKSGSQLGLRDKTRGTLFFEIMEIVRARRPRFLVLENVRNLVGPRHTETWATILASLREEGYRTSSQPVVFSPHLLPPERGGRPQVRERVFILAEFVGADARHDFVPLVDNRPVDDWNPRNWRVADWLERELPPEELQRYTLRNEERLWINAWQDLLEKVDEDPLPGFPIWVDAFVSQPSIPIDTPRWKANFLLKNSEFYVSHRQLIDEWLARWAVSEFPPSRRKFEWQARGCEPNLWKLALHLRPSGIRAKPPSYLPALVAITQTSVIGELARKITPREAARLQGFPEDFKLHENDSVAYRQLGNAVNVGAVKHVTTALFTAADAAWPRVAQEMLLVS